MLTPDELLILGSCVETEIAFMETAAAHGQNTRAQRATLAALSQKLASMIEESAKASEKKVE